MSRITEYVKFDNAVAILKLARDPEILKNTVTGMASINHGIVRRRSKYIAVSSASLGSLSESVCHLIRRSLQRCYVAAFWIFNFLLVTFWSPV